MKWREGGEDNDRRSRKREARCGKYNDVATGSLIEVWIDESEKRTWFLAEINHDL